MTSRAESFILESQPVEPPAPARPSVARPQWPLTRGWQRLEAWLRLKPKWALYLMVISVSFVVGWLDWLTTYEVNFALVYALLVVVTAWIGGRNVSLWVAVTNVVISTVANWESQPYKSHLGHALSVINRIAFWSFMAVLTDIVRRRQDADAERIKMLEEMRHMEMDIVRASEHEQQKFGQELHDGLCQQLAAISCAARALADDLQAGARPEADDAGKIEQALRQTVQEARNMARGIFPVHVDESGLSAALTEMAQTTQLLTGVAIAVTDSAEVMVKDPETAMHLYRIAQEAVANAVRHSGAQQVVLSLLSNGSTIELRVDDNGRGFPRSPQKRPGGMGLRTMLYRARALGAALDIEPRAGGGTSLCCKLKMEA